MALLRSLKTPIRNRRKKPWQTLLTFPPSSSPHPSPPPPLSFPLHGPLFLSSPPWILTQFASPLYLQCDALLGKAGALGLASLPDTQALDPSSRMSVFFNGLGGKKCFSAADGDGGGDGGGGGGAGGRDFSENFFNLPNMISMSRMVSGPLIAWMITNQWFLSAFAALAVSGATDWLDGYVARKMKLDSVIGSYLDPLADKVLIGCVAVAMVHENLLHPGLVGLVVLRDAVLVTGALYKRGSSLGSQWTSWSDYFNIDRTRPQKVEPLFISKVNTVFQLALVAAALLQPEFGTQETQSCITYLSWLVCSTTIASTAAYGLQHMRVRAML